MWPGCNRGIKQDEEGLANPGIGGGFTFSSALLPPLWWGVAAPVFGWHVSVICAFQSRVLCVGEALYMHDSYVRFMSHNKLGLWQLGVTHVLNAAHGKLCCKGNEDFYGTTVKYYGVPANDLPTFDLSPFFHPAAEFIHCALSSGGKLSHGFIKTWRWNETSLYSLSVFYDFQERCLCTVLWVWVAQLRWSWPTWWFIIITLSCPLCAAYNRSAGFFPTEAFWNNL